MSRIDHRDNSRLLSLSLMGFINASSPAPRKFVWASLAVVLFFCAPGRAHALLPHPDRHEVRHEIENVEKTWLNALLQGNVAAMDALLADDYIAITPNGILQSKEQALASIRSGSIRFKSIDLSDRKIRLYGKTALVTSRAEVSGTGPDGNMSGSYRFTRVYVKDSRGVWRIVSFESSRIRDPGDRRPQKAE